MNLPLRRSATRLLLRFTGTTQLRSRTKLELAHQRYAFTTTSPVQAKNKSKGKGSSASPVQTDSPVSLKAVLDTAFTDAETSSEVAIKNLNEQIKQIRAGRQDPGKLRSLKIPAEKTTLSTLAAVTQKNPKTFLVTVYDPAHVKQISSAIASSGQNFNPQPVPNNPTQLTINIPSESALAFGQKVKEVNEFGLKAKDAVRHARGNAIRAVRATDAPTDQMTPIEKRIHTLVLKQNAAIDKLLEDFRKALAS